MLDLRFVEKVGSESSTQPIDKFPCTIGRSKDAPTPPPYHLHSLISNGSLSEFHCTIEHDIALNNWTVTDGISGDPSTNGIWFRPREASEMERVESCVLQRLGDRVYLLSTYDGRLAYVEVFDPAKQPIDIARTTMDLDPALIRVREEMHSEFAKLHDAGQKRDAKLEKVSAAIETAESAGKLLIAVYNHRKELIVGAIVLAIIGSVLGPLFLMFLYSYRSIESGDRVLPEKIEQRN